MELNRNSYDTETTTYESNRQQPEGFGDPSRYGGADVHAAHSIERAGAYEDARRMDGSVCAASEVQHPANECASRAYDEGVTDATGGEERSSSPTSSSEEAQGYSCDAYPDTELDEENCAAHNTYLGRRGEDAAVRYLEGRGFEILERNWKCCAGEADIIAFDEDDLVFIEVKTRSNIKLGLPCEAVDENKRSRYERIAALYLRDFDRTDLPVRFDVIGILVTGRDRALLRHHVNAFALAC